MKIRRFHEDLPGTSGLPLIVVIEEDRTPSESGLGWVTYTPSQKNPLRHGGLCAVGSHARDTVFCLADTYIGSNSYWAASADVTSNQ